MEMRDEVDGLEGCKEKMKGLDERHDLKRWYRMKKGQEVKDMSRSIIDSHSVSERPGIRCHVVPRRTGK